MCIGTNAVLSEKIRKMHCVILLVFSSGFVYLLLIFHAFEGWVATVRMPFSANMGCLWYFARFYVCLC